MGKSHLEIPSMVWLARGDTTVSRPLEGRVTPSTRTFPLQAHDFRSNDYVENTPSSPFIRQCQSRRYVIFESVLSTRLYRRRDRFHSLSTGFSWIRGFGWSVDRLRFSHRLFNGLDASNDWCETTRSLRISSGSSRCLSVAQSRGCLSVDGGLLSVKYTRKNQP